jgi:hypothetical protein
LPLPSSHLDDVANTGSRRQEVPGKESPLPDRAHRAVQQHDVDREPHAERVHRAAPQQHQRGRRIDMIEAEQATRSLPSRLGE